MIFQYQTLLSGMPLIFMVSTILVLVPYLYGKYSTSSGPGRVTPHFVQLLEVWLILDSVYDPVHRLLEHYVYFPHLCFRFLNP